MPYKRCVYINALRHLELRHLQENVVLINGTQPVLPVEHENICATLYVQ